MNAAKISETNILDTLNLQTIKWIKVLQCKDYKKGPHEAIPSAKHLVPSLKRSMRTWKEQTDHTWTKLIHCIT